MRRVLWWAAAVLLFGGADPAAAQSRGDIMSYDGFGATYDVEILGRNPDGTFKVRPKGSTYKTDETDVPASALHAKAAKPATAAQAGPAAPCDWSAWGVLRESEFMGIALASSPSHGFDVATADLLCMVRTRKVDFQLSPANAARLAVRQAPELLAALRASYVGGATKPPAPGRAITPGRYACGTMSGIAGQMRFQARPDIVIASGGQYRSQSGGSGAYVYDGKGRIAWKSGPLAQQGWAGDYSGGAISVTNAKGQTLYSCTLAR